MPEPGSQEWFDRVSTLQTEEILQPETYWYMSFADEKEDKFNGACVVKARGVLDAIQTAHRLGINPGGQVLAMEVPADVCPPPPACVGVLMRTEEEVERLCTPEGV